MPRRLLLAAFSAAAIAILIAAPAAFADAFTPESGGSQNADDIDTLYKLTLYIGIVIFLLVEGTLIWSLVKYRARRGGMADQIRGNTPLEIGWTVGAASILVVLTVVTFLYLDDIESPPASGPNGLQAAQAQFASVDQPDPPTDGGPDPAHPREWPAVPLALRLPRGPSALLLPGDGGAHGTPPSCSSSRPPT